MSSTCLDSDQNLNVKADKLNYRLTRFVFLLLHTEEHWEFAGLMEHQLVTQDPEDCVGTFRGNELQLCVQRLWERFFPLRRVRQREEEEEEEVAVWCARDRILFIYNNDCRQ